MSNRVDLFFDLIEDESELFRRYIIRRKNWKSKPVFVFEGDDEKYYSAIITTILSSDWHTFIAGRRSAVIQLRQDIRKNQQLKNDFCYFFVDRDYLGEIETEVDLYVTPTHSIENLYCSPQAVRALVRGECGLARGDKDEAFTELILEWLMRVYNLTRSKYLDSKPIRQLNLMLSVYAGTTLIDKLNLNSNLKMNVEFKEISGEIDIEIFFSARGELLTTMKRHFGEADISLFGSRGNIRQFFNPDICRGKQEIFFLFRFIDSIKNGTIGNGVNDKFSRQLKINFSGGYDDLISFASQYADKPQCLLEFLSKVHGSRITAMI
jgi:hypothetical protein